MVSPSQSNVSMHLISPVWRWAIEQGGGSGELATRKTRSGRPEVAGVFPPYAPASSFHPWRGACSSTGEATMSGGVASDGAAWEKP